MTPEFCLFTAGLRLRGQSTLNARINVSPFLQNAHYSLYISVFGWNVLSQATFPLLRVYAQRIIL